MHDRSTDKNHVRIRQQRQIHFGCIDRATGNRDFTGSGFAADSENGVTLRSQIQTQRSADQSQAHDSDLHRHSPNVLRGHSDLHLGTLALNSPEFLGQ